MSARDLKTIMHQQIDALDDEEDVVDLFQTLHTFMASRAVAFDSNAPDVVARLQQSLAQIGERRGISTEELQARMQAWRTR